VHVDLLDVALKDLPSPQAALSEGSVELFKIGCDARRVDLERLLVALGRKPCKMVLESPSSGMEHYAADALGTTVALTDAGGSVQTYYSYEPFGRVTRTGTSSNELTYTGREDDGTGVYYYRARYYHPALARFITQDPMGFGGGQTNLYAYVANNPLKFSDSLGLRIDWSNQVLRNPALVENLWNLNEAIVRQGIADAAFTLRVSGGDRYRDCAGNIVSASDGKQVTNSEQDSRHLYENGAIAVDLVVSGVSTRTFSTALSTTSFDPNRTIPDHRYPTNPHVHIELSQLFELPLANVPDDLSGRKDVCR